MEKTKEYLIEQYKEASKSYDYYVNQYVQAKEKFDNIVSLFQSAQRSMADMEQKLKKLSEMLEEVGVKV